MNRYQKAVLALLCLADKSNPNTRERVRCHAALRELGVLDQDGVYTPEFDNDKGNREIKKLAPK